jgi:hypothetical protein
MNINHEVSSVFSSFHFSRVQIFSHKFFDGRNEVETHNVIKTTNKDRVNKKYVGNLEKCSKEEVMVIPDSVSCFISEWWITALPGGQTAAVQRIPPQIYPDQR